MLDSMLCGAANIEYGDSMTDLFDIGLHEGPTPVATGK
jgi:hypothetical protein